MWLVASTRHALASLLTASCPVLNAKQVLAGAVLGLCWLGLDWILLEAASQQSGDSKEQKGSCFALHGITTLGV